MTTSRQFPALPEARPDSLALWARQITKLLQEGVILTRGQGAGNTSVRVATTANVNVATDLEAGDSLDGVTLAAGNLVLVKNQTAPAENGVYKVSVTGAAPRADAFSTYDAHVGAIIAVEEGTANGDTLWQCTSAAGGTLGTTAITFVQTGDTVGPSSSTDNAIVRWDGTSGAALQDSSATLADNGDLTLNFTDDGASSGPKLHIQHISASPAANDPIGEINFLGSHSAGNGTAYAGVYGRILDPTDGSQDGELQLRARIGNVNTIIANLANGVRVGAPAGGYLGAGSLNAEGLFVHGNTVGSLLVASGVVSNAATLDLVLTSLTGFRSLVFHLTNFVPVTDDTELILRFSTNGGSSFDAGASDYSWVFTRQRSASVGDVNEGSNGDTRIVLNALGAGGSVSNVATEGGISSIITLFNPAAAVMTAAKFSSSYLGADVTLGSFNIDGSGMRRAAQNTDAIRLLFQTGNIASGNYAVYGLS